MQANAPLAAAEGERPQCCPSCGVRYPTHQNELNAGCPVCLLRQAMQSEAAVVKDDLAAEGRFDHYELIRREDGAFEELGRGAMGVTYKAFDSVLHHAVALKVIDARIAIDPDVRKRFLREARAAARLRHSNVASVFYYGVRKTDGQCFYAMEWVEGETLDAHLRRAGPLPPGLGLEVVTQVARALVAAEALGIVHRDLKPANLMLLSGPELMVKIIDFGLAKAAASAGSDADLTYGGFVGTPAFASPEQFAGVGVDIRSDLYSLGITLWEMLTGEAPFRGTQAEVMYQHLHAALPVEQIKGIPQPIVALLEILLEKDPKQRFQTPNELLKVIPMVTHAIEVRRIIKHQKLLATLVHKARPRQTKFPAPRVRKRSIAVLPFESLNRNKRDTHFADGVQDEILSSLAKVSQLKVISRTSVMTYRPAGNRDLNAIAKALGVAHVVEGTVRRDGNRVRITTRLIDARKDETLWCESYNRDLTDVFAIQSDIAQMVAAKLSARLSPEERQGIEENPTNDLEAYDLYLQAKVLIANAEPSSFADECENLLNAIRLLEEAVRKDTRFAFAYCLTAKAHDYLYRSVDRSARRRALGDAAVNEALALQPNLPEAHLAAAFHLYAGYRDYERARVQLAIARRSLPNSPDAAALAAIVDRRQGRWEESTRALEKAVNLDPRNSRIIMLLGENHSALRRYRDAERCCDRLIELGPDAPGFRLQKAECAFQEKADVACLRAALETFSTKDAVETAAYRIYGAALDHDWAAAREILTNSSHEDLIFLFQVKIPRECVEIWLAKAQGKRPTMKGQFGAARYQLKQRVDAEPGNPKLLTALAIVDAALDRKTDAIREATRAVEMRPISEDALDGPTHVFGLAVVYAWTNEPDLAFEQLALLAKTPSVWASYGYFKREPGFDPLRKDPRFDKLLAQLAAHE
jgi:eukaryotic-like serine/threonine-protein kinase